MTTDQNQLRKKVALKQVAILWGVVPPMRHELSGDIGFRAEFEEAIPGFRTPGENNVSGSGVLTDENFAACKTKLDRQPNCLASTVEKQLCCARHSIALPTRYIPRYITQVNPLAFCIG
jgi:hypothetical protein